MVVLERERALEAGQCILRLRRGEVDPAQCAPQLVILRVALQRLHQRLKSATRVASGQFPVGFGDGVVHAASVISLS